MKRTALFVVVLCLCFAGSHANAQLTEGRDYRSIEAHPVQAPGRIEVVEFFFYGCRSCYLLEPVLQNWVERNAQSIVFRRVPALRRQAWQPLSDLFYALQSLDLLPQLHDAVYRTIHEQERRLSSRSEQVKWASEHGIDATVFDSLLRSDAIAIATQKARDDTLAYDVRATPSIVVDGRYLTTGEMIGSPARVDVVLDQLLAMALASRTRVPQ